MFVFHSPPLLTPEDLVCLPEVNMRGYNIYSFFQATEMAWVVKNSREWLLTLDTGMLNVIPEYSYSDYQRGRTLVQNGGE